MQLVPSAGQAPILFAFAHKPFQLRYIPEFAPRLILQISVDYVGHRLVYLPPPKNKAETVTVPDVPPCQLCALLFLKALGKY